MSQQPHPLHGRMVEIRSSWWKQGLRLTVCVAALTLLAWTYSNSPDDERLTAYCVVLFFGIPAVWVGAPAARELVRFGPRLRISPEGLEDTALGVVLPWGEIRRIDEIDHFGKPRWARVWLRDETAWIPRLPLLKRLGYRSRRHLLIPLGGLALPASEVRDLTFAYHPTQHRRMRRLRRIQAKRRAELPRRGFGLWWEKWRFASRRTHNLALISVGMLVATVIAGYEAMHPPRVRTIEGTLERVEFLNVPGALRVTVATPNGLIVAASRLNRYRPESFPPVRQHADVRIRAFDDEQPLGMFHLTVDGKVWFENDRLPGDIRGVLFAIPGSIFVGIVLYIEGLWRWRMRQPPGSVD